MKITQQQLEEIVENATKVALKKMLKENAMTKQKKQATKNNKGANK